MKKALLIFLMLLFPWQAIAATDKSLAHVLGSVGYDMVFVAQHMGKHAGLVMHHHDDSDNDGDDDASADGLHQDDSQQSVQHLFDYDHGYSFNILFPVGGHLPIASLPRIAPAFIAGTFTDRTTIPLLRPPRRLA